MDLHRGWVLMGAVTVGWIGFVWLAMAALSITSLLTAVSVVLSGLFVLVEYVSGRLIDGPSQRRLTYLFWGVAVTYVLYGTYRVTQLLTETLNA